MTPTNAPAFDRRRGEVETLLSSGESFAVVEETIERSELGRDEKAALWLLAWSSQPAAELRENLRATLALFGGDREMFGAGWRREGSDYRHAGPARARRLIRGSWPSPGRRQLPHFSWGTRPERRNDAEKHRRRIRGASRDGLSREARAVAATSPRGMRAVWRLLGAPGYLWSSDL